MSAVASILPLTDGRSDHACHCAQLAVSDAARYGWLVEPALRALAREMEPESEWDAWRTVWHFNDTHKHAEVLAAFTRAIRAEENQHG